MIKKNFHTHTTYCDGKNTAREMVEAALELGFTDLGFSGHSHTSFDESYCMSLESSKEYKKEIEALKKEYAGRINLYCGLEYDYFSDEEKAGWDYLIGSVHYVEKDGRYITIDYSADVTLYAAERFYGGDIYALCEDYFRQVADVVRRTGCDIVGHFDLITKFNEYTETLPDGTVVSKGSGRLFDERHPRYIAAYNAALDEILGTPDDRPVDENGAPVKLPLIEINTGAMARGYRTTPYPSEAILKEIFARGGRVIVSSDTHDVSTVGYGFDKAAEIAAKCGFKL